MSKHEACWWNPMVAQNMQVNCEIAMQEESIISKMTIIKLII